ncbi:MAG TPA: hypothetical protein VKI44_01145 [Acetobacteraceae bacterium]|nr:hypothetical protein [Acetobacteraceae bacterium]
MSRDGGASDRPLISGRGDDDHVSSYCQVERRVHRRLSAPKRFCQTDAEIDDAGAGFDDVMERTAQFRNGRIRHAIARRDRGRIGKYRPYEKRATGADPLHRPVAPGVQDTGYVGTVPAGDTDWVGARCVPAPAEHAYILCCEIRVVEDERTIDHCD